MMMEEEMEIEWIEENEETASARPARTSHIRSCCVEGCRSKGYRLLVDGERVQYFGFPLYDQELCERWASTIRLAYGVPYEKAFVCSKHFLPADYRARIHEESKRTLRRSAIPSLEPVIGLTPPPYRQALRRTEAEETTEESEEDSAGDDRSMTELETLISQTTQDGDNLTVLVVHNPDDQPDAAEEREQHPVQKERLKLPLVVADLLEDGPPFPWRKQGIENWIEERTPHHEEYLQKLRDAITEETVMSAQAEQDCEERIQLLSLIVVKKGEGRLTLKNFVKAMTE